MKTVRCSFNNIHQNRKNLPRNKDDAYAHEVTERSAVPERSEVVRSSIEQREVVWSFLLVWFYHAFLSRRLVVRFSHLFSRFPSSQSLLPAWARHHIDPLRILLDRLLCERVVGCQQFHSRIRKQSVNRL